MARFEPGNAEAGRDDNAGASSRYNDEPAPRRRRMPHSCCGSGCPVPSNQLTMGDGRKCTGMVLPFCVGDADLFTELRS